MAFDARPEYRGRGLLDGTWGAGLARGKSSAGRAWDHRRGRGSSRLPTRGERWRAREAWTAPRRPCRLSMRHPRATSIAWRRRRHTTGTPSAGSTHSGGLAASAIRQLHSGAGSDGELGWVRPPPPRAERPPTHRRGWVRPKARLSFRTWLAARSPRRSAIIAAPPVAPGRVARPRAPRRPPALCTSTTNASTSSAGTRLTRK